MTQEEEILNKVENYFATAPQSEIDEDVKYINKNRVVCVITYKDFIKKINRLNFTNKLKIYYSNYYENIKDAKIRYIINHNTCSTSITINESNIIITDDYILYNNNNKYTFRGLYLKIRL